MKATYLSFIAMIVFSRVSFSEAAKPFVLPKSKNEVSRDLPKLVKTHLAALEYYKSINPSAVDQIKQNVETSEAEIVSLAKTLIPYLGDKKLQFFELGSKNSFIFKNSRGQDMRCEIDINKESDPVMNYKEFDSAYCFDSSGDQRFFSARVVQRNDESVFRIALDEIGSAKGIAVKAGSLVSLVPEHFKEVLETNDAIEKETLRFFSMMGLSNLNIEKPAMAVGKQTESAKLTYIRLSFNETRILACVVNPKILLLACTQDRAEFAYVGVGAKGVFTEIVNNLQ